MFALHTYLMYLKFGFGRATQDAGIEIRRGAMTREQGINLVKLYDGSYPEEFINEYLVYFQMSKKNLTQYWINGLTKKFFIKIKKDGYLNLKLNNEKKKSCNNQLWYGKSKIC